MHGTARITFIACGARLRGVVGSYQSNIQVAYMGTDT